MSAKIRKIVAAVGAVGIFSAGMLAQSIANDYTTTNNTQVKLGTNLSKNNENISQSTKIAIVNLDNGTTQGKVDEHGSPINEKFSEEVLNAYKLDNEIFEITTKDAAKNGLAKNKYGAVIIFDQDFSENIIQNINEIEPQPISLHYEKNQDLTPENDSKIVSNIEDLTNKINIQLSYLYISNIFTNIHQGQDYAQNIIERDDEDLNALENIKTLNVPSIFLNAGKDDTESDNDKNNIPGNDSVSGPVQNQPDSPDEVPPSAKPEMPNHQTVVDKLNQYYENSFTNMKQDFENKLNDKNINFNKLLSQLHKIHQIVMISFLSFTLITFLLFLIL